MIPGPTNVDFSVLSIMSQPTISHFDPEFIKIFGQTLKNVRKIFFTEDGHPFIVSGSGTLAMEMGTINFLEKNDGLLVVKTGSFGDRFATILKKYHLDVDELACSLGEGASPNLIREKMDEKQYKMVVVTHVDTGTGVVNDIKKIGDVLKDYDGLFVVDGVCSIGAEEFFQDNWNVDVCVAASQKALAAPPGLAIGVISEHAKEVMNKRRNPLPIFYGDLAIWLPVMDAHEKQEETYFSTPPVNLILALYESTRQILNEGVRNRICRHHILSRAFKEGVRSLNLKQIPKAKKWESNALTTLFYPEGVKSNEFLNYMRQNGVVVASGIYKPIKDKYFRVGHLGNVNQSHILLTLCAIERSLASCGCEIEFGRSISAAQSVLEKYHYYHQKNHLENL